MRLLRSRSVALVTALLLLAGGLFGCSAQHDRNHDVQREMEAIERKIVPSALRSWLVRGLFRTIGL